MQRSRKYKITGGRRKMSGGQVGWKDEKAEHGRFLGQ